MGSYSPIEVCIAVSLYMYNVAPLERATKLHNHFEGNCYPLMELVKMVDSAYWATEMPYPTAAVYVQHALERYGKEAEIRAQMNS